MNKNNSKIVGYLGPQGTHSEDVCSHYYPKDQWDFQSYATIDSCIRATANGAITESIVPIENSLEGSINITLDTLAHEVNLFITKEIVWPIHNHLLTKSFDDQEIHTIVSHAQPLAQCRHYLAKHYPHAKLEAVVSTVEAVRIVASGAKNYAAIANMNASKLYNMNVVAADIQDHPHNCTRFVVLSNEPEAYKEGNWKTSIVCKIKGDKPGSLYHLLQELASFHVNLVRIESRPARTELGEYIFFMDMEGSIAQTNVQNAINALENKSLWFKNLGSYLVCKVKA
ncbi:prephenate dehydratase [Pelosinus sp. sgz500959]|uniref:prephenate dehydratase n=1 Tax=Pelosinus sp. sgz500959 TaxID=3242472 RepID=UPI00366E9A19